MAAPVIGFPPRAIDGIFRTIDRTASLSQKLEFCFIPAIANYDLSHGYVPSLAGTATYLTSTFGRAVSPSTTRLWTFAGIPDGPFLGPITIVWVGRCTTNSPLPVFVRKAPTGATLNIPLWLDTDQSVPAAPRLIRANATLSKTTYTITSDITTTDDFVVVVRSPGTIQTAPTWTINNGSKNSISGGTATGAATGTEADLVIGPWLGRFNMVAIWSRFLTDPEVASLWANPYGFLTR